MYTRLPTSRLLLLLLLRYTDSVRNGTETIRQTPTSRFRRQFCLPLEAFRLEFLCCRANRRARFCLTVRTEPLTLRDTFERGRKAREVIRSVALHRTLP